VRALQRWEPSDGQQTTSWRRTSSRVSSVPEVEFLEEALVDPHF
jgi:hypothetical protein